MSINYSQDGWKEVILRDLCEDYRYGYTAKARENPVGPKLLRITDIVPELINWDSVPYCKIQKKNVKKYLLQEGDIVIARTGATTGYAKRIRKGHPQSVFASYLVRLRIKQEVDNRFIGYIVESDLYKEFISTNMGGAAQPNANAKILTSFPLKLPSLPLQRKVAFILSAYDNLIVNNTHRIQILDEMAQLIYREWFVHYRFPGHENVKMVESETEYGEIPEGWEIIPLANLVSTQYGYTTSKIDEPIGPKFLRGMDINKSSYIEWASVPFCEIPIELKDKYKLHLGDITIIRMADPGKAGIVEQQVDGIFASYLVRLKILNKRIAPYFLFYFLNDEKYQGYISGASTGTTRKSASSGVLVGLDIICPPPEIIEMFETQIKNLRNLLNNLIKQNNNLRKTRDLLIPQLISGYLDVSNLDMKET